MTDTKVYTRLKTLWIQKYLKIRGNNYNIKTTLINAKEVAEILGTSKPHAYKVVQQLHDELRNRSYIVIAGKVSRSYFEEKIYGLQGGRINIGIQK